jgi:hypothetical protein
VLKHHKQFPYLSGTIVTQQGEDLVLVHLEAEVVDRHLLAKGLAELVDDHSRRAQQRFIGWFIGNWFNTSDAILFRSTRYCRSRCGGFKFVALFGKPVRRLHDEVEGLGHTHL